MLETTSKDVIARRAKEFVDDQLIQEILASMRNKALNAFENSHPGDAAAREAAYALVKAIEEFKSQLHIHAIAPRVDAANTRAKARSIDSPQALDKALNPNSK